MATRRQAGRAEARAYPRGVGPIGGWDQGLWALLPTLAVAALFWFVMRAILRADRTERAAQAKYEAEYEAQRAHGAAREPVDASDGSPAPDSALS